MFQYDQDMAARLEAILLIDGSKNINEVIHKAISVYEAIIKNKSLGAVVGEMSPSGAFVPLVLP